jgi:hypothetical protein
VVVLDEADKEKGDDDGTIPEENVDHKDVRIELEEAEQLEDVPAINQGTTDIVTNVTIQATKMRRRS